MARIPDERIDRDLLYDPVPGKLNRTYADIACLLDTMGSKARQVNYHMNLETIRNPLFRRHAMLRMRLLLMQGLNPLDMPFRNSGVFVGHTRSSGLSGDIACHAQIEQVANYSAGKSERIKIVCSDAGSSCEPAC